MTTVTACEAKARLGTILARVLRGEEIVIIRPNKAVARIVPAGERQTLVSQAATRIPSGLNRGHGQPRY